jgi:hypothetical protein
MAYERGESAAHFDFYGGAGRRGQDDDGSDQLAQRPYPARDRRLSCPTTGLSGGPQPAGDTGQERSGEAPRSRAASPRWHNLPPQLSEEVRKTHARREPFLG